MLLFENLTLILLIPTYVVAMFTNGFDVEALLLFEFKKLI